VELLDENYGQDYGQDFFQPTFETHKLGLFYFLIMDNIKPLKVPKNQYFQGFFDCETRGIRTPIYMSYVAIFIGFSRFMDNFMDNF